MLCKRQATLTTRKSIDKSYVNSEVYQNVAQFIFNKNEI